MIQDQFDEHFPGLVVNEGHMLLTDMTTNALQELIDVTKVKKVFEIGFNAGHSAFGFLTLNPGVVYHSIDIGRHKYTRPCAETMKSLFEDRFEFSIKDSLTITAESIVSENYDMVYIDGDHKFDSFRKDYQLCVDAKIEYVLIDDINLFGEIRSFVDHLNTSKNHPYTIVQYFDFENDTVRRNPTAAQEWKITKAVLLKLNEESK